ncbi:MAG: hypothetical protein Q7R87_01255 [Nanoarchaeota archaeon]|nr:hypothetical protein [Nanoarchaeota archaeon]
MEKRGFLLLVLAIFLLFPAPYLGGCLYTVGISCPSWIFLGGLSYTFTFFDLIITAITSKTLPAYSLLIDAFMLLPWIIGLLVVSYGIVYISSQIYGKLYFRPRNKAQ